MNEKVWDVESRTARVREIASWIVTRTKDESPRETMHAIALAAGALIQSYFETSRGREAALSQHIKNVTHHAHTHG